MAKLTLRGSTWFFEIDKICNKCGGINTCFEPVLENTSETSKRFYKNNPVENCGKCGNYI